jgi:tetratricopeptide (TPR) repeat protein
MNEEIAKNVDTARKLFDKGDYGKAETLYMQIKKKAVLPEDKAIIWAELSWLYYNRKMYEKSIEAADNVFLNNENYEAKERLFRVQGYAYLGLSKSAMAAQYLELSLEQNSELPEQQFVRFELGKLYFKSNEYDKALPLLEEIEKYFENENKEYYFSILFFLGFSYYYLESLTKAKKRFDKIIKANPSQQRYVSALFGLAYVEYQNKNFLEVITLCEKIISLDENFFDKESVGFLTAASYLHLGREDIFTVYFNQMSKTYPSGRYINELKELQSRLKKN